MSLSHEPESAVTAAREAVADQLWAQHCVVTHQASQPRPEGWGLTRATDIINAWMRASNPVGKSQTIYDDFYRLRAVARLVLAAERTANSGDAIEALRAALIAVGDPYMETR